MVKCSMDIIFPSNKGLRFYIGHRCIECNDGWQNSMINIELFYPYSELFYWRNYFAMFRLKK